MGHSIAEEAVWGGNRDAVLENLSFPMHSPPVVPRMPQVIGLLTVPQNDAAPEVLGHHVADFLAWATLFEDKLPVDRQVWLSAFSIPDVIKATGATYAHGEIVEVLEEGEVREEPLEVKGKKVTAVLENIDIKVADSAAILKTQFLEEVSARSAGDTPVIIIVCGETTPEMTIYFDGNPKIVVNRADIQQKLRADHPATLVTPAPFAGGFHVNPFLGRKPSVSDSVIMQLISQTCGGAFADNINGSFIHHSSPLFTEAERDIVMKGDLVIKSRLDGTANLTSLQSSKNGYFHLGIQRALSARLGRHENTFILNADEDEWPLGKRGQPNLGLYKEKWDKLPAILSDMKDHEHYIYVGRAFGGTTSSQSAHAKFLAKLELDTCYGDWDMFTNKQTRVDLTTFLAAPGLVSEESFIHVMNLIEYRSSTMILADITIAMLGLARPQGKSCRDWDYDAFKVEEDANASLASTRRAVFAELNDGVLPKIRLNTGRYRDKLHGINFLRPAIYLSTAIVTRIITQDGGDKDAAVNFVRDEVEGAFEKIVQQQMNLLTRNEGVMDLGRMWIASLDLENADYNAFTYTPATPGMGDSIHAKAPPYFGLITNGKRGQKSMPDAEVIVKSITPAHSGVVHGGNALVAEPKTDMAQEEQRVPAFGAAILAEPVMKCPVVVPALPKLPEKAVVNGPPAMVHELTKSPHVVSSPAVVTAATNGNKGMPTVEKGSEVDTEVEIEAPAADAKPLSKFPTSTEPEPKQPVTSASPADAPESVEPETDAIVEELIRSFPEVAILRPDVFRNMVEFMKQRGGSASTTPTMSPVQLYKEPALSGSGVVKERTSGAATVAKQKLDSTGGPTIPKSQQPDEVWGARPRREWTNKANANAVAANAALAMERSAQPKKDVQVQEVFTQRNSAVTQNTGRGTLAQGGNAGMPTRGNDPGKHEENEDSVPRYESPLGPPPRMPPPRYLGDQW